MRKRTCGAGFSAAAEVAGAVAAAPPERAGAVPCCRGPTQAAKASASDDDHTSFQVDRESMGPSIGMGGSVT